MARNKSLLTEKQRMYTQLVVYCATLGPLTALLVFFYCIYIIRFNNNSASHKKSVFGPLVILAYRTIKFHYPGFILACLMYYVLGRIRIFGTNSEVTGYIYYRLFLIFTILVNLFVQVYQLTIAAVSVLKFIHSQNKSGSRITRKTVNILIRCFVLLVILKDCGWYMYKLSLPSAWFVVKNEISPFDLFDILYTIHHMIYQFLIFIGMGFTFFTKPDPEIGLSERMIVKQTKTLGIAKLIMLIVAGAGLLLKFEVEDVLVLICSIDLLLVPVIIEITEKPNKVPVGASCEEEKKKPIDSDSGF
ncbi:unnamed protein product [Caenorhabditis brenneri]